MVDMLSEINDNKSVNITTQKYFFCLLIVDISSHPAKNYEKKLCDISVIISFYTAQYT